MVFAAVAALQAIPFQFQVRHRVGEDIQVARFFLRLLHLVLVRHLHVVVREHEQLVALLQL